MGMFAMRLDRPGVRLGWALGASFVLHLFVLAPVGWQALLQQPSLPQPLMVQLPEPELASAIALTTKAEEVAGQPEPTPLMPAVSPVPKKGFPAVTPTFAAAKPKPLRGKALATAMATLSQEMFYPHEAIERGVEGRVILLLHLDVIGRIQSAEVASSSGHAMLDDAALQAVRRITSIAGSARQVLLPVDFRLE